MNETFSLAVLGFAILTYAALRKLWGMGVRVERIRVSKGMPDAIQE